MWKSPTSEHLAISRDQVFHGKRLDFTESHSGAMKYLGTNPTVYPSLLALEGAEVRGLPCSHIHLKSLSTQHHYLGVLNGVKIFKTFFVKHNNFPHLLSETVCTGALL